MGKGLQRKYDGLMRIKFMISILSMLFKQPIVLASITFLAGCYQIVKGSFTALRCGHDMVSLYAIYHSL